MKRVRCPKCDQYITFDETKYEAGQSLVFKCPDCGKEFGIRIGVSKLRERQKDENPGQQYQRRSHGGDYLANAHRCRVKLELYLVVASRDYHCAEDVVGADVLHLLAVEVSLPAFGIINLREHCEPVPERTSLVCDVVGLVVGQYHCARILGVNLVGGQGREVIGKLLLVDDCGLGEVVFPERRNFLVGGLHHIKLVDEPRIAVSVHIDVGH